MPSPIAKAEPEETVVTPADEEVPDWITQLGQTGKLAPVEELPPQEEEPAWMAQLRETPPAPFSEKFPLRSIPKRPIGWRSCKRLNPLWSRKLLLAKSLIG